MGIFLADRFGGPHPPDHNPDFPTLRRFAPISHRTIAEGATTPRDWVWSAMGHAHGSLTRALHHTALHTYMEHRDDSRAQRDAPPKWEGASAQHGAVAWQLTKKGIAGRARKIRHLWDLRWHEENQAVAQGVSDLHKHHCLIYRRGLGTQAHILCECPVLAQVRLSNHIDFNRAVRRLPPGPERTLGQAIVHLLHFHQPLEERGQLWTGLWTAAHRHLIQGALAGCTLRAGRKILRDLSTRAAMCVTHRWTLYQEALADYANREAALTPSDVDVSPPVTPPPAHLGHHGSGALSAHPQHEYEGSEDAPLDPLLDVGPPQHYHRRMRLRRWPRTPPTHRTGPRPPAHDHHMPPAISGTPAWGRTTAKQPTTALVPTRTHCEIRGLRSPHSERGLLF